jgi:cholinesterase
MAASGNKFIFVTINYRVGLYGFLAVDGLPGLSMNNGLRDQRKALLWIQMHIAGFGGDPKHVVIGGASAGAASVSLQLTAFGGDASVDPMFIGAAAESVSFATVLTPQESSYQFWNLSQSLGCSASSAADALTCMRAKTATELQAAGHAIPYPQGTGNPVYMWNPVVDGDFLRDVTYKSYMDGKFFKVPLIAGDDTNGGSVFAPRSATTLEDTNTFLKNTFPYLTTDMITRLDGLYPNPNAAACPTAGCYWTQASNVYGDMRYMCPSMFVATAMAKLGNSSWAYRWDVQDPAQVADGVGVPHVVEQGAIFGPEVAGAPASYYPGGSNAAIVPAVQGYWASFITTLNPNTNKQADSAEWKPWSEQGRERMWFQTGGATAMEMEDSAAKEKCDYIESIGVEIKQ